MVEVDKYWWSGPGPPQLSRCVPCGSLSLSLSLSLCHSRSPPLCSPCVCVCVCVCVTHSGLVCLSVSISLYPPPPPPPPSRSRRSLAICPQSLMTVSCSSRSCATPVYVCLHQDHSPLALHAPNHGLKTELHFNPQKSSSETMGPRRLLPGPASSSSWFNSASQLSVACSTGASPTIASD